VPSKACRVRRRAGWRFAGACGSGRPDRGFGSRSVPAWVVTRIRSDGTGSRLRCSATPSTSRPRPTGTGYRTSTRYTCGRGSRTRPERSRCGISAWSAPKSGRHDSRQRPPARIMPVNRLIEASFTTLAGSGSCTTTPTAHRSRRLHPGQRQDHMWLPLVTSSNHAKWLQDAARSEAGPTFPRRL